MSSPLLATLNRLFPRVMGQPIDKKREVLVRTESIHGTSRDFTLAVSQTNTCGKIRHVTDEGSELEKATPEWQVTTLSKG